MSDKVTPVDILVCHAARICLDIRLYCE